MKIVMEYNSEIHHRRSIRLKDYDYSQDGYYFVTICVKHFVRYLGEIKNGEMGLSMIGKIVREYWNEIPYHFNNVMLDEMVIMPDHFHGIVIIDPVRACHGMPLLQQFAKPKPKSLSMIVNHFKSAVKRWCNKNNFEYFQWQRNYYEHIIRDEKELYRIRQYIKNNPLEHLNK